MYLKINSLRRPSGVGYGNHALRIVVLTVDVCSLYTVEGGGLYSTTVLLFSKHLVNCQGSKQLLNLVFIM